MTETTRSRPARIFRRARQAAQDHAIVWLFQATFVLAVAIDVVATTIGQRRA